MASPMESQSRAGLAGPRWPIFPNGQVFRYEERPNTKNDVIKAGLVLSMMYFLILFITAGLLVLLSLITALISYGNKK